MKNRDIIDNISENNVQCSLGINKETGRLQWCPGCCSFHRMLIIIPIIMITICVLMLFVHLDFVQPVRDHQFDLDSNEENFSSSNLNDPRCHTVRVGVSETLGPEEREILKDVRTEFIPPDLIIVPPNCINENSEELDVIQENNNNNQITDQQVIEFLKRKRRSRMDYFINETNSYDDIPDDHTEKEEYLSEIETKESESPWKILGECEPTINAELEEGEIPKNPNCDQSSSSIVFHAFWKGEGTAENIRSTQVEIMKQYMDTTVKPCDDFYQYACGNWEKLNPIPKDKAAYDTFEMLRESLDSVLQDLLKNRNSDQEKSKYPTINKIIAATNRPSSTLLNNQNELDETMRIRRNILKRRVQLNELLTSYIKYQRKRRDLNYNNNYQDAERKAKDLYESCMNYELIARRGIEPLLNLIKQLGGWPVLDQTWNEETFDWLNLTAHLRLYNNDIFLAEWVGPDIKNSEENIIQFDQSSLGLPSRDYFLQPTNAVYLEAYEIYMKTIISLLGCEISESAKVSREIVDFETELAKITSSPEERTNVSILYKRMTLENLHQSIPEIDWTRYLSIILERPVNQTEMIVMFATNYMQELVKLISKTEKRTISNYLIWRFVRHRINNLDDRFQDAKQKFYKVLFGREQSPPRWKNCVGQVNSNMGMAVGAMFVRKYFDENSKKDTLTMTYELQQAFREILNATEWIDESTKYLAEQKVNAMSLKIGFPDYILTKHELNEKYNDLDIHPKKYFENTLNVLLHLTRNEQNKLGEIVNKTAWHTAPAVVNAYYSRNKNQIMFPAGILQPPFYHRYFPRSLNYGGIGVVIGHELTHGFDDKGRLFDRDGNLHRWWTDTDIDGFHERARCLISQYGNYTVAEVGIPVDGENTQGENIADNGGIKQAFRAYQKWLAACKNPECIKNEQLPGLNATNNQLFFLNFAQVWCGAMRPEATRNKLKTAVHSPGKFRVIGTLSNSEDFSRIYNCPIGSPMNPKRKCSVW